MVNMNECSMMVSIGYLKRIACIFESRSQNEEKIMLACMKEGIWIAVLIIAIMMIYRYENQVWKYVYKFMSNDLIYYTGNDAVGNSANKSCDFQSQPQPQNLNLKTETETVRFETETETLAWRLNDPTVW
jgi:hypothetical protein